MNKNKFLLFGFYVIPQLAFSVQKRPNILFVISDDQSYPYTSKYGSEFIDTPAFDFVANNGCLFNNAFVTSPGSSPSRASILTGLYPWQIEEAGTHASSFPIKYTCFPDKLESIGYKVGFTGKGWGPGDWKISGRKRNPAGEEYNKIKVRPLFSGISNIDYSENFRLFISTRKDNQPFYFWVGLNEPHRPYEKDVWKKTNKSLKDVTVPSFLPNNDIVKGDILDYCTEIEYFDSHLSKIINILKENNELGNTIIIVLADNGMPFPMAKATCYEFGIHVPLAICWGTNIKKGLVCDDVVSSIDLAPTILDAVGVYKKDMVGHSMLPYLTGKRKTVEGSKAFSGRERHSSARKDNKGYPIRSLRTDKYLYIKNFRPERWPVGEPCCYDDKGNLKPLHSAYYDIDDGPSWKYIVDNRDVASIFPYFLRIVSIRPYEELYDIINDPECNKNLISDNNHRKELDLMRKALREMQQKTKDTRIYDDDRSDIWETYPRLKGDIHKFPDIF